MRQLLKKEKDWLEKILSTEFKGRNILVQQVDNAVVDGNYNRGYISLKFSIERTIEKFSHDVRVPIELHAHRDNKVPIVFLLHVINGFIDELEVFNADSSDMDDEINIEGFNVYVNESVKY